MFRKKLSRGQFLKFLSEQPTCVVAMEACASSHYWGREFLKLGYDVRLIPPIYVKPFVERQKTDANDAAMSQIFDCLNTSFLWTQLCCKGSELLESRDACLS